MGTLGQYLRSAREARGIDLRDAAQQTRIGITYLKALEEEDFARLPGEVFVKGFLKNYGKFLSLDEFEVMKRFGEMRSSRTAPGVVADTKPVVLGTTKKVKKSTSTTIEPFLWGAGIVIAVILFVFTSLPERHKREMHPSAMPISTGQTGTEPATVTQTEKLYLEVIALENTWLFVRTDNSPQKKALLQKGESLIWSADERFLLSYNSVKALQLFLNGRELTVNEPGNAVVRDLTVVASGIVDRSLKSEKAGAERQGKAPDSGPQLNKPEAPKAMQGPPTPVSQTDHGQTSPVKRKPAVNQQQPPRTAPNEIQGPPAPLR